MSYCLNPQCSQPENSESDQICQSCGSELTFRGRYRTLKRIGQGSFGRTFLAVDIQKETKTLCVIKQFFPMDQGKVDLEKANDLFELEAVRLSKLGNHPQIPKLLDHFYHEDRHYLVQTYVDGPNLEQDLQEYGPFNEENIRQLLEGICPILKFVHDNQVIHRDIKPANIIRQRSDGQLFLVDFGASRLITGTQLAATGTIIGSAEYVAPEQARGKAIYASDLYSLGVVCIYLMTQVSPFDLYDNGEDAWVWDQYLQQPISSSLIQILNKLLQKATSRRYQRAEEVLCDLGKTSYSFEDLRLKQDQEALAGSTLKKRLDWAIPSQSDPQNLDVIMDQNKNLKPHRESGLPTILSNQDLTSSTSSRPTLFGSQSNLTILAIICIFLSMNPFALPMAVVILPILFHYWRRSKSLLFIFTTSSLLALFVAPHIALRISDNINSRQSNNHSEVEKVKQPLIEESVQTTAEKPAQIIDHQATLLYPTQTITLSDRPSALISNPQEKKLIYANHNGEIKVIDPNTGNVIKLFKALYPTVTALSLSNDGRILAASSYDPSSIDGMNPGKGGIDVWNQTTGQSILSRSLEAETMSVALTPDGQTLASSSANGLRLWNIKTGELIHTFPEVSPGTFITISKDGQLLISGGFNGEVRIWNLSSYSLKSNISVNSSAKPPRSAIHSMAEADKILAVEAVTTIKLYKLETGESLSVFPKSIHIPSSIAFSPDGRTLAIGEDHLIRLWDIETGKQIGVLKYLKNDFFSISGLSYLDESTLVSSSEASLTNTLLSGTIEIWKIDDLSRQK